MNSDNFLIDEFDLEQAKDICNAIEEDEIRQRAVANALAAKVALKYFSPELDVDAESGLFNVSQVLNYYEISDIYIRNNYIDVRLYFNENELCVPKSHYDNDIQPVAYMFIKLEEDVSGASVTGFVPSDAINTTIEYDGYYRVSVSDLVSFFDIEPLLTEIYEADCPEEINQMVFDFLDGNLVNTSEFYKLLLSSKEARLRLKKAAKAELMFNYISTVKPSEEISVDDNAQTNLMHLADSDVELLDEQEILVEEPQLSGDISGTEGIVLEDVNDDFDVLSTDEDVMLDYAADDITSVDLLTESDMLEENNSSILLEGDSVEDISTDSFEELSVSNESVDVNTFNEDDNFSVDDASLLEVAEDISFDNSAEFDFSTETTPSLTSFDQDANLLTDDIEPLEIDTLDESEVLSEAVNTEIENIEMVDDFVSQEDNIQDTEGENNLGDVIEVTQEIPEEDNISLLFDDEDTYNAEESTVEILQDENDDIITEEIADYNPSGSVEAYENSVEPTNDFDNGDNDVSVEPDNVVDNNSIEALFNQDDEQSDSQDSIVDETNYVQPKRKSFVPALGLAAVLIGVGYFGYNKYMASQSSLPTESITNVSASQEYQGVSPDETQNQAPDAMPIETIENTTTPVTSDEGLAVSIPAIEKNLDASILVSNLKINWEVPLSYTSNSSAKRYLTKLGKVIQLNLKSELLLLNKIPISNKIILELEFDKATSHFKVKSVTATSGEKSIDAIIKQTVEKALNYNLSVGTSAFATLQGNPKLVIHL